MFIVFFKWSGLIRLTTILVGFKIFDYAYYIYYFMALRIR